MEREIEIQTARLTLRRLRMAEARAVAALLGDFEVSRWLTVVPHPYAADDARAFIGSLKDAPPLEGLGIFLADDLIGGIGIGDSLGYWLGRPFHGNGYMTEAAQAVVERYFTDGIGTTLTSGYFTGNTASARVLAKLGFTPTHDERVHARALDAEVTLHRLALTRESWRARDA